LKNKINSEMSKRAAQKSRNDAKRRAVRPDKLIDATLRELRNPASRFYGVPRDMFDFYMTNRYLVQRAHIAGDTHADADAPETRFLVQEARRITIMCIMGNGNLCTAYNTFTAVTNPRSSYTTFTFYSSVDGRQLHEWEVEPCIAGGMCATGDGLLAVTNQRQHCVSIFTAAGKFITHFGGYGQEVGELRSPAGIVLDDENNLAVCDYGNGRLQVFTVAGDLVRTISCNKHSPVGIAVNPRAPGVYYVTSDYSRRVTVYSWALPSGIAISKFTSPDPDADPVEQICFDAASNAFTISENSVDIRFCTPDNKLELVQCDFDYPIRLIAIDSAGRLYVCTKHEISVLTWKKSNVLV
jgi:hypothetical protein